MKVDKNSPAASFTENILFWKKIKHLLGFHAAKIINQLVDLLSKEV